MNMQEIFLGILQFSKAREERRWHVVGVAYVPKKNGSTMQMSSIIVGQLNLSHGCTYVKETELVTAAKTGLNIPLKGQIHTKLACKVYMFCCLLI